ncbi:MAG: hypothetical protein Q7T62_17130 [Undibacterium sp.]|nr:hypothetical protein [Undibacterium sp.]
MEKSESEEQLTQFVEELSATLFELRDALYGLSLAIKDWQFENDIEKRKTAEIIVNQLLQRITFDQNRSTS